MRTKPLVSIVVPTYNVESYVEECIQSILNQTYTHIELFIVDDGSKDRTVSIVRKLENQYEKIKVYCQKVNKGQATARNIGIDKVNGDYLLFVDSDDFLHKETVAQLVKTAEEKKVDMVRFNAKSFSDEGEPIKEKEYNFSLYLKNNYVYDHNKFNNVYLSFSPSPVLYLLKTDLLRQHNVKFHEGIIHEDELFSAEVFLVAKSCVYINEAYYQRRYRSGSTMTERSIEQKKYSFDSYIKVMQIYQNILIKKELNDPDRFFIKYRINTLWLILKNYSFDKDYIDQRKKAIKKREIIYTKLYKNYIRLRKIIATKRK